MLVGCPTVRVRIVSAPRVQVSGAVIAAPDDHFAAGPYRCMSVSAVGALVLLVGVQLSVLGLYLPAGTEKDEIANSPPQMIISLPVHTAVCESRASGGPLVAVQVSSMQPPSDICGSV